MRSLLFTRNPTKPLMKQGNDFKGLLVNVLTMAFSELPQLDTFNNSLNSKTIKMLRSAAVEILGQNASRRFSNYLKASQSSLLRRSANDSRIDEHAYYPNKSEKNKEKNFVHAISIDFSKEDPFSGSTTTHSDDLLYSSPVKTMINFGEVRSDELLLLLPFTTGVMMISTLKRTLHEENFKKMSN
ncbi:hypothetical protein Tco_1354800 [Tanacetum coccineum]